MQDFDDRSKESKSHFNPDDKRPEGPVRVELTEREASILRCIIGTDLMEQMAAAPRPRGQDESKPSEGDPMDWGDFDRFQQEVFILLGEGANGFEYDDFNRVQGIIRTELMLFDLGETKRVTLVSNVTRDEFLQLLTKFGGS